MMSSESYSFLERWHCFFQVWLVSLQITNSPFSIENWIPHNFFWITIIVIAPYIINELCESKTWGTVGWNGGTDRWKGNKQIIVATRLSVYFKISWFRPPHGTSYLKIGLPRCKLSHQAAHLLFCFSNLQLLLSLVICELTNNNTVTPKTINRNWYLY